MPLSATQPVYLLLVDDLEENLLSLEVLLRREGLILLKATSGTQALELLLKYDVALALLDVQMPEMGGFELAETMRGAERTKGVPIIFLTAGSTDRQRRFQGYEAGAVDFLQKPLETDILKSKVDVFVELYRQRQQIACQRDHLQASAEENLRLLNESRTYAEALKEADRLKDEFLATLAHELRNPLAPISNSVSILSSEKLPQTVRDQALQMMERQVKQMVHLVDDLMDVSRITRGKIELKRENIRLEDVISSAVETSAPLIEQHEHRLTVSLPDETIYMDADMSRMTQVFSNLLNNAAKYSPPKSDISITASIEDNVICVKVRDTGIGIRPEMAERIFDLFAQVDGSLERSHGGLGVGLTLVKNLAEMHGGSVNVKSDGLGKGSEFIVCIRRADTPEATTPEAVIETPEGTTAMRVMIVEDNEALAQTTGWMVEMLGYDYKLAHSGKEALETAPEYKPHVMLLDIGMPGMNGYDLCVQLRQDPILADTVFVAQTGWGQSEHRIKAKEAGFHHHLVKPVYAEVLQALLADVEAKMDA